MDMLARIFAETGMRRLYKGLLKLVVKHQDKPRMVRLRNQFVQIDPAHWNADLDVKINVAPGTGATQERIGLLAQIAAKQEQMLMEGAPLANFATYRNTLAKMVEMAGYPDASEFFLPFGQQEQAAYEQAKAQAPQPKSESQIFEEIEMAKIQAQTQQKQADLALKAQIEQGKQDLEKERLARDFTLRAQELQLKMSEAVERSAAERERLRLTDEKSENDAILRAAQIAQAAQTQATSE
jgi:hypothetical protein